MKKFAMAALAGVVLAVAGSVSAAPNIVYVKSIDVSSASNFPAGITFYNGALFVASFNNKSVLKIADPLGATPTVTNFKDLSAAATWGGGRGLHNVNVDASGNLYAVGDTGTTGFFGIYDQAAATVFETNAAAQRLTSVVPYAQGSATLVGTYVLSSSLRTYSYTAPNTLTEVSVSGTFTTPVNANIREVVVDGTTLYFSRNGTTADAFGVVDNSATPGNLATLTATQVFAGSGTNGVAVQGIGLYNYAAEGKKYLLCPDITAKLVNFVNVATGLSEATAANPVPADPGPRDSVVANIGGAEYLFVTAPGATPPTGDVVHVFAIDPSAVEDWSMYN